jgi:hypothetical protein
MNKSLKRIRFEKVASRRVQKIIDFLNLLENCANRNNYEYTEQDVELMYSEILKALKESKNTYINELDKNGKKFFKFVDNE